MTGEEDPTLAGILLFVKDKIIAATVPVFRDNLIKRVDNYDNRYDARLDLRITLIDTYDCAMNFVAK
jgi:predicted HTH transcriptional regulator